MAKLTFRPPDKHAPGFLRRNIRALELQEQLKQDQSPEALLAFARFLAQFIEADNETDALEALLDASQSDFEAMTDALQGNDPN